MDKEASRLARDIYSGKFKGTIDKEMTLLVAKHLSEAVTKGSGENILQIDYNSPDVAMLANLDKNIYQFSAAKNYHQLKQMTQALKDEKGKVRSFAEFKKEAAKVNKIFNHDWLKTEYNTAISSANAAARWKENEQDKDVMPYLRYETAGDERVRSSHALLDNVVRRVDDPFWDEYYPPNGFNCRCTTVQEAHGPITGKINKPELHPMFRTNTGKAQVVFPKGHPYFKGIPKKVMAEAAKVQLKATRRSVLSLAKQNLLTKKVFRKEVNGKIGFTVTGIKETINQPHKAYLAKTRLIPQLDKILEKAVYLKRVKYVGKDVTAKYVHYFQIQIDNKKSYIVVKELYNGELSVYSITDKIKK